jgi:hypothetical protein
MKLTVVIALAVAGLGYCSQSRADCYMRVATNLTQQAVNSQPVDVQRLVTPDARGQKCVMRYRIHIKDDWETAEGVGTGATEADACAQALDIRRGSLLAEATPTTVRADSQMVCSDLPDIRVHPVRIGDIVWESETDLHTIPAERKYFLYKRTQCRMFVERDVKNSNLWLYQGVMCRLNARGNSKWQVIDKY